MSKSVHGRLAITILTPTITPLLHSAAQQYLHLNSSKLFQRGIYSTVGRNTGFCPLESRQAVILQHEMRLASARSSSKKLPKFELSGTIDRLPISLIGGSSKWLRFPTVFMPHKGSRGVWCQRGGLSTTSMRRRHMSSVSNKHESEGHKNDAAGNEEGRRSMATIKLATRPNIANKHIMDRLPNIKHIHRPTKEELLAAATGFWSRLKVRFKWFSIRSVRPFNIDEIGAFFSWVLVGHVLWIILGTTTFFSLAIFAVNTVFAQGDYLCSG
jgi:hypothetical protein